MTTEYMIRRTDTGDFWDGGNPFKPGREHWTNEAAGTRYDAMSLAIMESVRFDRIGFGVEIVPVKAVEDTRAFERLGNGEA